MTWLRFIVLTDVANVRFQPSLLSATRGVGNS